MLNTRDRIHSRSIAKERLGKRGEIESDLWKKWEGNKST
jgi:hypothetical protein